MASDETLLRLAEICTRNGNCYYAARGENLSDEQLRATRDWCEFTDIYALNKFYRPFDNTVFRSITEDQDRMLVRYFLNSRPKMIPHDSHVYLAIKLDGDMTPEDITEPSHVMLGIV